MYSKLWWNTTIIFDEHDYLFKGKLSSFLNCFMILLFNIISVHRYRSCSISLLYEKKKKLELNLSERKKTGMYCQIVLKQDGRDTHLRRYAIKNGSIYELQSLHSWSHFHLKLKNFTQLCIFERKIVIIFDLIRKSSFNL